MKLSIRKKLSFLFIALFVILAPTLVFYLRGYRIDISNLSIKETGAVYVQVTPKNPKIYLNGKIKDPSNIIARNGNFIKDIASKKYLLEVKLDGYNVYKKNIFVKPLKVVQLLNVVLLPTKIKYANLSADIKGNSIISISNDGEQAITYNSKNKNYYVCNLSAIAVCSDLTTMARASIKQSVNKFMFYTPEENTFIAFTNSYIYKINTETKSVLRLKKRYVGDVFLYKKYLYYISTIKNKINAKKEKQNNISKVALSNLQYPTQKTDSSQKSGNPVHLTKNLTVLNAYDISSKKNAQRFIVPFEQKNIKNIDTNGNKVGILLNNGKLFILNTFQNKMKLVATSTKSMLFSPNGTKLLYQTNSNSVFVYMLEDDIASLNAKKGDKIKIWISDEKDIKSIKWSGEYHFIIEYPNKITFAEVDYRKLNNQYTIYDISENSSKTSFFFSLYSDALYIENENKITYYAIPNPQ